VRYLASVEHELLQGGIAMKVIVLTGGRGTLLMAQAKSTTTSPLIPVVIPETPVSDGRVGKDEVRAAAYEVTTPVLSVMLGRTPELSGWTLPVTVRPSTWENWRTGPAVAFPPALFVNVMCVMRAPPRLST
jgi:hypothetical protein